MKGKRRGEGTSLKIWRKLVIQARLGGTEQEGHRRLKKETAVWTTTNRGANRSVKWKEVRDEVA